MTVSALTYTDSDNASQTLDSANYVVDSDNQTITITDNLPSTINYQVVAAVTAPAAIDGVEQAIKIIVTDLYELRTETAIGVSLAENPALKALLYPYRESLSV
jgi:hypothetical protein